MRTPAAVPSPRSTVAPPMRPYPQFFFCFSTRPLTTCVLLVIRAVCHSQEEIDRSDQTAPEGDGAPPPHASVSAARRVGPLSTPRVSLHQKGALWCFSLTMFGASLSAVPSTRPQDERRGISSDLGPSSNRDDLYLQSLRDTNEVPPAASLRAHWKPVTASHRIFVHIRIYFSASAFRSLPPPHPLLQLLQPSLIEIADYISGSLSQRKVKGKREKDPAAVAASALKRKRASKGDAAAAGEGWEGAHDAGYWGAAPGGEAYNPEEADAATAAAAIAMASIDGGAAGGIAPLGAPGARKAAKREIPAGRGRGVRHPPLQVLAATSQHPPPIVCFKQHSLFLIKR